MTSDLEWKEYVGFKSVSQARHGYYFEFPKHLGTRSSSELTVTSEGYVITANSVTVDQIKKAVEYLQWYDSVNPKTNEGKTDEN